MPKRTTQDPGQRALDIAVGEAERRYRRANLHDPFDPNFDYFGNALAVYEQVIVEMGPGK